MFRNPYDSLVTAQARENIKKIDDAIAEEIRKGDIDRHKILRLQEQKLIQDLFYGGTANNYAKYRSPW